MADTFVAITEVKHGNPDGSVVTFEPGEEIPVTEENRELLTHLYVSGSLAVAGSPEDPNTWVVHPEAYTTTPAVVEESLRQQAADRMFGQGPRLGTNTQPHQEPASDPAHNLKTANAGGPDDEGDAKPDSAQAAPAASDDAQE